VPGRPLQPLPDVKFFATPPYDGAFSQFVAMPAAFVYPVPDSISDDAAGLLEPLSVGVWACRRSQVAPGSSVAVFGAGGVGLNAIQGAAIAGAERIVAVDAHPAKLELARTFGATDLIDATKSDPVEAIRALTNGRGADYVFEAIGNKRTVEQAYEATRKAGTCVVIGLGSIKESVSLNLFLLPLLEKRLLGCWYGSADVHRDIPRLLSLYRSGKLKLDALVTRTYALAEINEAFAAMVSGANARGVIVF